MRGTFWLRLKSSASPASRENKMIRAFGIFSLTTVYSDDELEAVNDETVETNSESEVAEFVNDADDYVSKPPYIVGMLTGTRVPGT